MKKKCRKNYFKGPKMAAKDDVTILFAATILTAPTVCKYCNLICGVGKVAKGEQSIANHGQVWMGIHATIKKAGSPSK